MAVFSPSMLYPGSHEKRALSPSAVPVISTSPLVGASGSAHVAVEGKNNNLEFKLKALQEGIHPFQL